MRPRLALLIFALTYLSVVTAGDADTKYARARIESCPGCSLNRLPEVKSFIYDDVPKYENVEFKKIHGAPPELVLLDELDAELDRLKLGALSRKECNELLSAKGFHLKADTKLEL